MAADFEVKIHGLDELRATLMALPAKLAKRALRNALAAGARIVRDTARARTPILKLSTHSGASAFRRGIRRPGTVRNAIVVRTSKNARREGKIGVFVNVRPSKGGRRGTNSPTDPFYWRWLNFGRKAATRGFKIKGRRRRNGFIRRSQTGAYAGARFLEAGAARLNAAMETFKTILAFQLNKLNRNSKDPL